MRQKLLHKSNALIRCVKQSSPQLFVILMTTGSTKGRGRERFTFFLTGGCQGSLAGALARRGAAHDLVR